MTLPGNPNANNIPQVPLYDAVNHQMVAWQADDTTVTTDSSVTPNVTYAQPKAGSVTVSPPTSAVSTVNSTTTLLTSGSTFTGTSESILAYGSISVQAYSDVASAASGLIIEQSQDGTNWDTQVTNSVSAATAFQTTVNATGKFFRIVYTNGGTNQATFRLQTIKEVAPAGGNVNQRVNTHSGDIASGSFASGAIASGAYASGSIGSGAVASGAVASGAIVDGANATLGAKADTAITDSTTTNTQMSFTKGLVKILADIWDSTNHLIAANIKQINGITPLMGNGTTGTGSQRVTISSDNTAFSVNAQPTASTSGGSTPYHLMSAATTNATNVKNAAGQLYGISISNAATSIRYFKLYNKASAPSVGTDVPILTLQVPASGLAIRTYPVGLALGTGISFSTNTGIADNDTGSVGLNDLSIDLDYK